MNPAVSDGYSWADDTSCGLTSTGDVESPGGDPQLGALADNGGPTQTQLPATTSPLVDTVPDAGCQIGPAAGVTTDQRGDTRPGASSSGCDTGAVELQFIPAPVGPPGSLPPATVPPSTPALGSEELPRTGASTWVPLAVLGVTMLACGGVLVATVRRRRSVA